MGQFLIFAQGRTGSTLLSSLLSAHSEIQCDGEILETRMPHVPLHISTCRAAATKPMYGFKVKIYQLTDTQQLDPMAFLNQMARENTKIIFLGRRNLLRHALSNYLARENRYHFRVGDTVGLRPIRVEPADLLETMNRRAAYQRSEEAAVRGVLVHRMVYEDDLIDPGSQRRSLRSCCAFLGVRPERVSTDLVRSVTGPVSSYILNYSDVVDALAGTPYEQFLTDPAYD